MIEIQIILEQLDTTNKELKKTLKRRKEIAIQKNVILYKQVDIEGLLNSRKTGSNDEALIEILEKNSALIKEEKDLKRIQNIQLVTLYEAMEKKKKAMEDKLITEEDKRQMAIRLEERSFEVQKLTNNQLDMITQLIVSNQETNRKDLEIIN